MYFAGLVGLFAAVVLLALLAFVSGLVTRAVKRIVRATRSRTKEP
jgi:di/tricarboxylate transporter